MKKDKITMIVLAILLMASLAFSQGNARTAAIGNPNVDGRNLIDDVSDIFYFPSEVAASTNMAQGVANSYVYVSSSAGSVFNIGFLLNNVNRNYSTLSGFATVLPGVVNAATAFPNYSLTATAQPIVPSYGSFDVAPINAPPGVAHLLLGMNIGDALKVGADLSYERSSSDVDSSGVTVGPPSITAKGLGNSTMSALGIAAGAQLNVAMLKIKASFGFVNLGYAATMEHSGTSVNAGTTTTFNRETSELNATKGSYIPISAKASMDVGVNTFTLGADFVMGGYQFEGTFDDGDASTLPDKSYKSDDISTTGFGVGLGDEIKVTDETKLIGSLAFSRSSTNAKPPTISEANREVTTTTTTLPLFCLGMEHIEKSVWKFDQVALRAGGSKSIGWTSRTEKGGTATSDVSNAQTANNWNWQTGVGLTMGRFDLGMTVATANWNGVYFLTGTGPAGATVTLTYNFGASSAAPTP